MKILLTGFTPFAQFESNPSQLIVEQLARHAQVTGLNLITEVLPTEFASAGHRITELIRRHRPGRIICLGLAAGLRAIHLERVALNLDDTAQPDNAGSAHQGKLIVPQGPLAYWSTLPIEKMCEHLNQRGIAAAISNHAGTYVCNHVFYLARHEVELLGLTSECGFIHLPAAHDLPLEITTKAIELCLHFKQK